MTVAEGETATRDLEDPTAMRAWLQGCSGRWWLDPRTKALVLVLVNLVSVNLDGSLASWAARCLAMALSAGLWLSLGRPAAALGWALAFTVGLVLLQGARHLPGQWALIGGIGTMVVILLPVVSTALYALRSTRVSEAVAAMDRLRMPTALIVPLSVVFRFLPTIHEEHRLIADAMRLRGVSWRSAVRNPISLLEHLLVPLLISLVRIGDDLTAAALTRGLGGGRARTHVARSGLGRRDLLVVLAFLLPLAVLVSPLPIPA